MDSANWGGAISNFSDILGDSRATQAERCRHSMAGLGKGKYYKPRRSEDFKSSVQIGNQVPATANRCLGMPGIDPGGGDGNIRTAITILSDDLGLKDPLYKLTLEHTIIGVVT